jgi:hypothetical protein
VANFNRNNPRYQKEIQRAYSKGSMTGNRPITENITAKHAAYQLGRQERFKSLALDKAFQKSQHEFNLARIKQANRQYQLRKQGYTLGRKATEDRIKQEKENLDWTIGLGVGQLGYSTLEGRRRQKEIEGDVIRQKEFLGLYKNKIATKRDFRLFGNVADYSSIGLDDNI